MSMRFIYTLPLVFSLMLAGAPEAYADRAERAQEELADAKKELSGKKSELSKAKAELGRAEAELRTAKAEKDEGKAAAAESKRDTAQGKISAIEGEIESLKDDVKRFTKKLDREEEDLAKKSNCPECDKKAKEKKQTKTGWEGFAEVVKAVTPLGLGAMSTYAGVKAMNLQSADYNTYASTMAANGLPFAQNSANYQNTMGSFFGGNTGQISAFGSVNAGGSFNPFLSGVGGYNSYAGMMGQSNPYSSMMGGYNSYASMMGAYNPYASMMGSYNAGAAGGYGYSPYGTSTAYNPYQQYSSAYGAGYSSGYSTGYNGNMFTGGTSYYGADLRVQQQASIYSSDAQAAGAAYLSAQQNYNSVLGGTSGYYGNTNYYQYGTTAAGGRQ